MKELELNIPPYGDDDSIIQTLKISSYAGYITEGNIDDSNSTITLFSGMTHLMNSIVRKSKTIEKAAIGEKIKIRNVVKLTILYIIAPIEYTADVVQ